MLSPRANLDNANICLLASLVHWNLRDSLEPVLDRIRDVRNDLHRLAQIVAFPL
jgi:hypothetical protein